LRYALFAPLTVLMLIARGDGRVVGGSYASATEAAR
jgi:hypothetical protein